LAQTGVTLPPAIALPLPRLAQTRANFAPATLDFRPAHDPRWLYGRGPPLLI
jgi:hypothetical protein